MTSPAEKAHKLASLSIEALHTVLLDINATPRDKVEAARIILHVGGVLTSMDDAIQASEDILSNMQYAESIGRRLGEHF
jgi:hypothetical protein